MGKTRILFILFAALVLFSSCAGKESVALPVVDNYDPEIITAERKNLKLGVVPGPYGDMFLETIQPSLAKKGYSVELVFYDDYAHPNLALANNEIDLNMFQNYRYLNNFKSDNNLELSAITEIPTASMGIFSSKYKSLNYLGQGITASIPEDCTNLSRALVVLETAGLIVINPHIDKNKATENDIIRNPYDISFDLVKAHDLAASLGSYDISAINGNYAISGGLNLSGTLYSEVLADGYINVIAVRTKDLGEPFVSDIIDIVNSAEYRNAITNGKYSGFQRPHSFLSKTE